MEQITEKYYFQPGDVVTLKQELPNKPVMMVVGKKELMIRKDNFFKGIICRWFTKNGELQENVFNTKDLILI